MSAIPIVSGQSLIILCLVRLHFYKGNELLVLPDPVVFVVILIAGHMHCLTQGGAMRERDCGEPFTLCSPFGTGVFAVVYILVGKRPGETGIRLSKFRIGLN